MHSVPKAFGIHCSFLCHTAPSPSSRSAVASETRRSRGVKVNPTFENQKAKPTIETPATHQDIRLQSARVPQSWLPCRATLKTCIQKSTAPLLTGN
jgi:hypothetical protein